MSTPNMRLQEDLGSHAGWFERAAIGGEGKVTC